jgi:hypothetical protein
VGVFVFQYIYYKNNIMKKIIRLTEADLARIVKKVIKENEDELPEMTSEMYIRDIEEVIDYVVDLFEDDLSMGKIKGNYDIYTYVNKMEDELNKLFMYFTDEENLSDEVIDELEIIASDMVEETVDYFYLTVEEMDFPDQFED